MKRILIADDIQNIVESLKEMLSPYYIVDTATSGLETLQLFKSKHYDGLIIDVDFGPGISGLETASWIRKENKDIKILVFSATDYTDKIRQKVVDLGAVFAEKPLELSFIRNTMEGKKK